MCKRLTFCSLFSFWVILQSSYTHANNTNIPSIVIDAASGAVISQNSADVPWYPASLTKLMTLALVFEALEQGHIKRSQIVWVSQHAASQPPKKLGLVEGSQITIDTAIKAVTTVSSNDAAIVLAEAVSGSAEKFVEAMNIKAKQLRMDETYFMNPSGWPDPQQLTSARDMAILARYIVNTYPRFYHYFSNATLNYKGKSYTSHNRFVFNYEGADGLKTGYTCGSGYNIVASAIREDVRLIGVVLGAKNLQQRYDYAVEVMNAAFRKGPDFPGLKLVSWRGSRSLSLLPVQVKRGDGCINLIQ